MDPASYPSILRREIARFADAAGAGPTDAAVPKCPGWTVDDLVAHQVGVFGRVIARLEGDDQRPPDPSADAADLAPGAERLLAVLDGMAPDTPTPALTEGTVPASWWLRRQVHEVVIHRVDAELARGRTPSEIEAELGADGIDELFELDSMLGSRRARLGPSGSIHVHCTDTHGEWMLRWDGDSHELTREHAKGDLAVRGPAVDLYLTLWGRRDRSGLDVFGDESLLDRWLG